MDGKRILVVDDEQNIVYSITEKLKKEGFEVRGLTDGAQAVDLYRAERFDLVLTDVQMPGMDGLEVLRAVMEYDPEALVVLITGFGTVDIAVEALKLGAREFMSKPLHLNDLVARLDAILEQQNARPVRGNLRDLGLTSIVSIDCNEMNEARLPMQQQGRETSIFLQDGCIVYMSFG